MVESPPASQAPRPKRKLGSKSKNPQQFRAAGLCQGDHRGAQRMSDGLTSESLERRSIIIEFWAPVFLDSTWERNHGGPQFQESLKARRSLSGRLLHETPLKHLGFIAPSFGAMSRLANARSGILRPGISYTVHPHTQVSVTPSMASGVG